MTLVLVSHLFGGPFRGVVFPRSELGWLEICGEECSLDNDELCLWYIYSYPDKIEGSLTRRFHPQQMIQNG